jgi:hypothetical protein
MKQRTLAMMNGFERYSKRTLRPVTFSEPVAAGISSC